MEIRDFPVAESGGRHTGMADYMQTSPRRAALVAALRRSAALIIVLTLLGGVLGLVAGLAGTAGQHEAERRQGGGISGDAHG